MKTVAIIRRLSIALLLFFTCASAHAKEDGDAEQKKGDFLIPLQERDSVLIGDQLRYGFRINSIPEGTQMVLPQWDEQIAANVEVVRPWTIDTLKVRKQKKGKPALLDMEAYVTIASFEEGLYELPSIEVNLWYADGVADKREFAPHFLDVTTIPVDTVSFEVHDIKGQIRYPVTFKEICPWLFGGLGISALIAGLIVLIVWLVNRRKSAEMRSREPAHIVALRKLDALRGDKFWAPDKQKTFYSGITDTLREYMSSRFDFSAMEMTTAEIMDCLKTREITPEIFVQMKELFERADYVKFAKHAASDEENAASVPLAVRFVTETYQQEIENESEKKQEGK